MFDQGVQIVILPRSLASVPEPIGRENTLWSTTAFSSNPSRLRPVFWTTTELLSTSFTELLSTPEFLSTSELLSKKGFDIILNFRLLGV